MSTETRPPLEDLLWDDLCKIWPLDKIAKFLRDRSLTGPRLKRRFRLGILEAVHDWRLEPYLSEIGRIDLEELLAELGLDMPRVTSGELVREWLRFRGYEQPVLQTRSRTLLRTLRQRLSQLGDLQDGHLMLARSTQPDLETLMRIIVLFYARSGGTELEQRQHILDALRDNTLTSEGLERMPVRLTSMLEKLNLRQLIVAFAATDRVTADPNYDEDIALLEPVTPEERVLLEKLADLRNLVAHGKMSDQEAGVYCGTVSALFDSWARRLRHADELVPIAAQVLGTSDVGHGGQEIVCLSEFDTQIRIHRCRSELPKFSTVLLACEDESAPVFVVSNLEPLPVGACWATPIVGTLSVH